MRLCTGALAGMKQRVADAAVEVLAGEMGFGEEKFRQCTIRPDPNCPAGSSKPPGENCGCKIGGRFAESAS